MSLFGDRMRAIIEIVESSHSPDSLAACLRDEPGLILLRTHSFEAPSARYSIVAARPMLVFQCQGSRCETLSTSGVETQFGNPWQILAALAAHFELLDEIDVPFPLGGALGYLGYDLKQFVEPRLNRHAVHDLDLPDAHLGFYDSLAVFDHALGRTWIVATGLAPDGGRSEVLAASQIRRWREWFQRPATDLDAGWSLGPTPAWRSSLGRDRFLAAVRTAQKYITAGDIYQVNLAQRLELDWRGDSWHFYQALAALSPSPFAAYIAGAEFALASSSPELFLRLSGNHILTRPIKGTRPRSSDPVRDAQLTYELQRSEKEFAELVMITDLLRNDLGRVCEFGSVQVPELVRLERYRHVQHLVSTVEGRLRAGLTHLDALAACFPGGSITGAPKIRAMEIIDELEPVERGPYTGCLGYLGFNRESQLSIAIRTAILKDGRAYFHAGAGIVSDSNPEAEYEETMDKARGFLLAASAGQIGDSKPPRPPRRLSQEHD